MTDRRGEHLFVELKDGTICSLPLWMFNPDTKADSIGQPWIAVEALSALRELFGSLQSSGDCGKASLNPPKEEESEATVKSSGSSTELATTQQPSPAYHGGQTEGTGQRPVELLISGFLQAIPASGMGGADEPEADN